MQFHLPVCKNSGMNLRAMLVEHKIVVVSAAIGVIAGATVVVMLRANSSGQWKASGDGKTIFNSTTGDIRYTASGRLVAEENAERNIKAEIAQEEYKRERAEREKTREAERLVDQQKRIAIVAHNSDIYRKVKKFVDDNPKVIFPSAATVGRSLEETYQQAYDQTSAHAEWERVTQPFRTGYLLTRDQRRDSRLFR